MLSYDNFTITKKELTGIFLSLLNYGTKASEHINGLSEMYPDVLYGNELNLMLDYTSKVSALYEAIVNDHMKVAIFGRTNSGKSTVVNTMLGENVLPSGIGHSINGFLQVERSPTGNAFLYTESMLPIQHDIGSATYLAHVLKNIIKPSKTNIVHVCWPKECGLLKNNVALIDSPGLDTIPCLDEWIYDYCIDADAFVLVVNPESTLMDIEMHFLHVVSKILQNANIFILINRSDESELFDQERKQKLEENIDLLEKKLEECLPPQTYHRIFFISAKDVLEFRLKIHSELQEIIDPFSMIDVEFLDFERQLQYSISRLSLLRCFNYSTHGKYLISEMCSIMDIINIRSEEQTYFNMSQLNLIQDFTEEEFEIATIQNLPTTVADNSFGRFDFPLTVEPNLPSISHVSSNDLINEVAVVGGIVIAGIVLKTLGWSWTMAAGAIFSGVCLYEEIYSVKKEKEQSSKEQYINHAARNLQLSVGPTSENDSQEIQQELSTTFAQADQLFDDLAINLNEEMRYVDSELNIITESPETPTIFINEEVHWLNEYLNEVHSFLMDKLHFF